MVYFLTVVTKLGKALHEDERHDTLDDVLSVVSDNYLVDADPPSGWHGYFILHDGEFTRLQILSSTAGISLRKDISTIDILNDRGLLERKSIKDITSH